MLRHIKLRKILTAAALGCFLFAVTMTISAFAADGKGFQISDDLNYLKITSTDPKEDIKNLAPGDRKESGLKIENIGPYQMTVYIRTVVSNEISPNGGNLADVSTISIKEREKTDYLMSECSFSDAAAKDDITVGKLESGDNIILDFAFYMPETADNRYQEASMDVKWVFTTAYVSVETPEPPPSNAPPSDPPPVITDPPGTDDPEIEITDDPVPEASFEPTPDPEASGTVVSPSTGDDSPIACYIALIALSLSGFIALLRIGGKKKTGNGK